MIIQSLEELGKELDNEKPHRVYLVLGPEMHLLGMAVDMLKAKFVSPDAEAFDYSEFSTGEASLDEIIEAAGTFPMIARHRVVLVTQVGKLKDAEHEELLESLSSLTPRTILILTADELDHRKRFYRTLRERDCVAEFARLKGPALERWAAGFFQRHGCRVSSSAIKRIVDLAGADLQSLAGELEKVVLYAGGSRQIPDSVIADLISGSRQQGIFDLINAVGRRDRVASLRSLSNLLSMGEHPLVVVSMMGRHCRQMMIAREGLDQGNDARQIGNAAQIPPFLLDQFLRQARTADIGAIRKMFVRLAETDRALKSSSVDGQLLLENLICTFV